MDLQRHISMCTRHHAKWKRMVDYAKTREQRSKYLQRAIFWLEMQAALISLWAVEQKASDAEARRKLVDAKSNLLMRLSSYGRDIAGEL